MKSIIRKAFVIALICVLAVFLVACDHPASSSNSGSGGAAGGGNGNGSPAGGGNGGGSTPSDPTAIFIGEKGYEKTGFVTLEGTTITGSNDNCPNAEHSTSDDNYSGQFFQGRNVTLSSFIISKYEVTWELYKDVMTGKKVTVDGTEYELDPEPGEVIQKENTNTWNMYRLGDDEVQEYRPVEHITWYDAVFFCNELSTLKGLTPAYDITVTDVSTSGPYHILGATVTWNKQADGYRLPTEAEWEYAARGGNLATAEQFKQYFAGAATENYNATDNADLDAVGWYKNNIYTGVTGENGTPSGASAECRYGYGTHNVGLKAPNAAGLYDMSGNVSEWCWDISFLQTNGGTLESGDFTNPDGEATDESSGRKTVIRGGSWKTSAKYCAVSCSEKKEAGNAYWVGIRLVRNAE